MQRYKNIIFLPSSQLVTVVWSKID